MQISYLSRSVFKQQIWLKGCEMRETEEHGRCVALNLSTEVIRRVFCQLDCIDLIHCSLVSRYSSRFLQLTFTNTWHALFFTKFQRKLSVLGFCMEFCLVHRTMACLLITWQKCNQTRSFALNFLKPWKIFEGEVSEREFSS